MASDSSIIALVGNPNVGKSTIFNKLTGMHVHVGNWAGVTVGSACGYFSYNNKIYETIDLPGIYSLNNSFSEEQAAKEFLSSGNADLVILICDATCLERGLHLLSQLTKLEAIVTASTPIILCLNLWDEAVKKGIHIDTRLLEDVLQIPVLTCCGRSNTSIENLKAAIEKALTLDIYSTQMHYACLDFPPKKLASETITYSKPEYLKKCMKTDRIVTGRFSGPVIMLLLLAFVFWLTMAGANIPSTFLWKLFFGAEKYLIAFLAWVHAPKWLFHAVVYGIYRVLAWVISVMLPPMAIFFPLFTLLEDLGYLPRIAFNMDHYFHRCNACGKQCLTMCMGLGCNAAGVTGCRIIDSPRERLIAIITNSFMPCNGRIPTLFTMIQLFFLFRLSSCDGLSLWKKSTLAALILTCIFLLCIFMTLFCSWILSHTVLKGIPSFFTLELPPYRKPQICRVLISSIFDRTLFVLARAVAIAAPAGLILWIFANIHVKTFAGIDHASLLQCFTILADPIGRFIGLDGIILAAFLFGFPANEIVMPIAIMSYLQSGILTEASDISTISNILSANGWTSKTIICMTIFCLFHWPCSTTCLTIKKETGSLKWTAVSFLLPTMIGILLCMLINLVYCIFH